MHLSGEFTLNLCSLTPDNETAAFSARILGRHFALAMICFFVSMRLCVSVGVCVPMYLHVHAFLDSLTKQFNEAVIYRKQPFNVMFDGSDRSSIEAADWH